MSCSSEVAFPPLGTGNVEEPSWLGDKPTSFESYIANFINLLQPLELPLDRLVDINATENGVTVKPTVSVGALLQLAKDYEIPIIATAALPFLLLLLSKLCCSLFCLLTCMCNGTGKPKKRPLAATLLFLLFSGAMLNAAVYTLMSSYALNSKINNLPYEIAKSVNYIPTYANVTKEMLDRLLANDFDLLLQHMRDISLTSDCILEKAFIDKGFEHPNDIMTTFSWKYKTTREYQKILSQCASSADTCESQTKGLSSSITKINTSAGAAALKAIGMVEQASDSITEVRSIAKGLISSLHYVEDAIGKILEYRPQFEKYNSYRSTATVIYAVMMCVTSFGLVAMAVFLLCFFGPKGGPCHAGMSGCVENLLTVIICFTRLLALLGSIVFLALFFAGAHVHLVCRPLEDVETAKGFVGLLSSTGNKLLHSMLKSSLGISENGTSVPFFNASELTDVINNLSTTSIIRDCKQRKTLFVVLKLNTLNLPVKLANILDMLTESQLDNDDPMHAQVPRIEKGNSSLLATSIQSSNRLSPGNDELYLTPLNPKECANSKDMLKNCLTLLQRTSFNSCPAEQYDNFTLQLQSLLDTGERILVLCEDGEAEFKSASMAQLSNELLIYGKHLNQALENNILPCDVVIYSVGGIVNAVCWSVLPKLNCWTVAVGLWCLLAIFTGSLSRPIRRTPHFDSQ